MNQTNLLIRVKDNLLKATLDDNATSRDFIKRLPLKVIMKDLFSREKYIEMPGLEVEKSNIPHFSRGDISYYMPTEALVFYYEGHQEPLNGLVKMGDILEDIEVFEKHTEDVEVTIEVE